MKPFFIILLLYTSIAGAQTYEIGILGGASNYIGDVGKENYINPNQPAWGGIFKWNRSPRHAFRGSFLIGKWQANDQDASDLSRQARGYTFENNFTELSLGIEYTFWEFNLHEDKPGLTPYLFSGLNYLRYNALAKQLDNRIVKYARHGTLAIPMVIGAKIPVSKTFLFAFEAGARYTFTDNLDGSNPQKGLSDEQKRPFGNLNSDDWYFFSGITITLTFGRKPCYCNF